jgi:hypothetical protein
MDEDGLKSVTASHRCCLCCCWDEHWMAKGQEEEEEEENAETFVTKAKRTTSAGKRKRLPATVGTRFGDGTNLFDMFMMM